MSRRAGGGAASPAVRDRSRSSSFPVAVHFKGSGFYSTDYGRADASRQGRGDSRAGAKKPTDKPKSRETRAERQEARPPTAGVSARSAPRAAGAVERPLRRSQRRRASEEHRDDGDVVLATRGSRTRPPNEPGSPPSRQCSDAGSARKRTQPSWASSQADMIGRERRCERVADERQAHERSRSSRSCRRPPPRPPAGVTCARDVRYRTGRAGSCGCASRRALAGRPCAASPCSKRHPSQLSQRAWACTGSRTCSRGSASARSRRCRRSRRSAPGSRRSRPRRRGGSGGP